MSSQNTERSRRDPLYNSQQYPVFMKRRSILRSKGKNSSHTDAYESSNCSFLDKRLLEIACDTGLTRNILIESAIDLNTDLDHSQAKQSIFLNMNPKESFYDT